MGATADGWDPGPEAGESSELSRLRRRVALLAAHPEAPGVVGELVRELETAWERLRGVNQEVRAQRDEIRRLVRAQEGLQRQHERILALLPVPVLSTDGAGRIRSANAAAAAMSGHRLTTLLRMPILALFAPEDRSELRHWLVGGAREHRAFRGAVTVLPRTGEPLRADLLAAALPGSAGEINWVLLGRQGPSAGRGDVLPAVLVELGQLPLRVDDRQELLQRAGELCRRALPPGCLVSINLGDPSAPEAVASTDRAAQEADAAQMDADEGPCVAAYRENTPVLTADMRTDARWPRLAARRHHGLRGVASAPIRAAERVMGALNVYIGTAPDEELLETVDLLGSTIGGLLAELELRSELSDVAGNLKEALVSRATIDQAKGIIMADRHCTADEAFEHLTALSSSRHVKLRDVAQQIVDQAVGVRRTP